MKTLEKINTMLIQVFGGVTRKESDKLVAESYINGYIAGTLKVNDPKMAIDTLLEVDYWVTHQTLGTMLSYDSYKERLEYLGF